MAMSIPPRDFDPDADPSDRSRLERLIPELLKKVIETGSKNLSPEAVRQVLGELKLPKEALHYTFSQLDETKNGVYRLMAKELRELFERTNIAEELARALSLLSLEIKMQVRFKPTSLETKTRVTTRPAADDDADDPRSEQKEER